MGQERTPSSDNRDSDGFLSIRIPNLSSTFDPVVCTSPSAIALTRRQGLAFLDGNPTNAGLPGNLVKRHRELGPKIDEIVEVVDAEVGDEVASFGLEIKAKEGRGRESVGVETVVAIACKTFCTGTHNIRTRETMAFLDEEW